MTLRVMDGRARILGAVLQSVNIISNYWKLSLRAKYVGLYDLHILWRVIST
jgi:hypothetical protein